MLSLRSPSGQTVRPVRHWKSASAFEAVGMIRSGATVAVSWLGDGLGQAIASSFSARTGPDNLTIVYARAKSQGRNHGLNLLAHEGLVRRVVGGQWYPVPGLQALANANRIEAYSLPASVISRLFGEIADGVPGHISKAGLGTFADPRHGGGRLNPRTREQLVRVVHPAGNEALLFNGFSIDAALIGVGFMEETAAIAVTREAQVIARAARRSGGVVIAQLARIGTLDKLPVGQVVVPDTLVDILVESGPDDHLPESFVPLPGR